MNSFGAPRRRHEPRVAATGAAHLHQPRVGLSRVQVAAAARSTGRAEHRIGHPPTASHNPIRRVNPAVGLTPNGGHNG